MYYLFSDSRRRHFFKAQVSKMPVQLCTQVSKKLTLTPGSTCRPARIAELPHSKFDPELFPHSAYVEIFVTFATKVSYLTFCNKM